MFRIGHFDLIVAFVMIFILFSHYLPRFMRTLGRGLVQCRHDQEMLRPMLLIDWMLVFTLIGLLMALIYSTIAWR
jgi:hypothetical protein